MADPNRLTIAGSALLGRAVCLSRQALAVLLLLVAQQAFALVPTVTTFTIDFYWWTGSDPAALCQQAIAQGYGSASRYDGDSKGGYCRLTDSAGNPYASLNVYPASTSCPANSTASGNACSCNSGYLEKNGQCISKLDPDMKCATDFTMAGFGIGQGLGTIRDTKTMNGVVPSGEMCWPHESATSGCLVNFDRTGLTTMPDGSIQSSGSFSMYKGGVGGKACTLEPPQDPGSTVEEKCEQKGSYTDSKGTHSLCLDPPECEGGFMGTVSYLGGEVCIKDKGGNVIETSKDTIKKNEDGSTDKVTEKTTCKGNTCTTEKTTTTTTNNNTSSSSTTTKTESREDYCKANANAQQCKGEEEKEGKFGGSCEAGFTCEGDALQCAVAKEQYKRSCQMFETPSDESKLYHAAVAKGRDADVTATLPGNKSFDVSNGIQSSDLLGGARCVPNLNITVWGRSVSLPLSDICPALGYMGWVLVAVSGLVAFRIVSGTSKDD